MNIPSIDLPGNHKIPQIGLGLWQIKDASQFSTAFKSAVNVGYRHFDCAQIYNNEHLLGIAWKELALDRSNIFITTKIDVRNFGSHRTLQSFEISLNKLKTDYVDLLLLHFPVPVLRKKAWQTLEQIQISGRAKNIGVSNFTIKHLESLKKYAKIMPAINQVELHLFLQQPELTDYCSLNDIAIEAYSPLAHSRNMNDQTIHEIARKYNKSYAQIMLRWGIERGYIILPKSTTPSRIMENINIFDFSLDKEDLRDLSSLDSNLRTCWNPTHVP